MPETMRLNDGRIATLFSEQDFSYLIEKYMGYEAAEHFQRLLEELKDYREHGEADDDI